MTAQINDTVRYQGRLYAIAGIEGEGLFDPSEHGLHPSPFSTACYRGYYCSYDATEDGLRLRSLGIGLGVEDPAAEDRGEGPELFSTVPRREKYRMTNPETGEEEEFWSGPLTYEDLDVEIPFTGRLLLGDDFIEDMYVHMGFHPAACYQHVVELRFEQGELVSARDRSEEMAERREANKDRKLSSPPVSSGNEDLKAWIADRFSRDLD